jgi:hypothetical protein
MRTFKTILWYIWFWCLLLSSLFLHHRLEKSKIKSLFTYIKDKDTLLNEIANLKLAKFKHREKVSDIILLQKHIWTYSNLLKMRTLKEYILLVEGDIQDVTNEVLRFYQEIAIIYIQLVVLHFVLEIFYIHIQQHPHYHPN